MFSTSQYHPPAEDHLERPPHVARHDRLGAAGLEERRGVVVLREDDQRLFGRLARRRTARRGRVHADDAEDPVGVEARHRPHRRPAPVVAAEEGPLDVEGVKQPHEVGAQVGNGVAGDVLGPVGQPVAAHIGRDGPQPRRRIRAQLVAPRVRQLGEAVDEHDRQTLAPLVHRHADAVGVHELRLGHAGRGPHRGLSEQGRRPEEGRGGEGGGGPAEEAAPRGEQRRGGPVDVRAAAISHCNLLLPRCGGLPPSGASGALET